MLGGGTKPGRTHVQPSSQEQHSLWSLLAAFGRKTMAHPSRIPEASAKYSTFSLVPRRPCHLHGKEKAWFFVLRPSFLILCPSCVRTINGQTVIGSPCVDGHSKLKKHDLEATKVSQGCRTVLRWCWCESKPEWMLGSPTSQREGEKGTTAHERANTAQVCSPR